MGYCIPELAPAIDVKVTGDRLHKETWGEHKTIRISTHEAALKLK